MRHAVLPDNEFEAAKKGLHVEDIDCSLVVRPTRTALDMTFFGEVRVRARANKKGAWHRMDDAVLTFGGLAFVCVCLYFFVIVVVGWSESSQSSPNVVQGVVDPVIILLSSSVVLFVSFVAAPVLVGLWSHVHTHRVCR